VIITKSEPYTAEEIEELKKTFSNGYIKTVIDIKREICSAGADRHFESEKVLLDEGSKQSDIWGGGIDPNTQIIDLESFINIRANQNNNDNVILDMHIREKYENLTKFFFRIIYE